ncbi:hypothetical protein ACDJ03_00765 [Xanthomonas axonopodis pv. nakataecorchori]|uniref:hypothetical protein n=1 Tax=Xanthomonas axonopodis TaxID=53413 RepID=UPI003530EF7F
MTEMMLERWPSLRSQVIKAALPQATARWIPTQENGQRDLQTLGSNDLQQDEL